LGGSGRRAKASTAARSLRTTQRHTAEPNSIE
jgi:hypothetical protein